MHFSDSCSSDTPVYTDLSNNNVVVMNNSLYSAQAPVNILSNIISQYMTTSTTGTSSNERKRKIDRNWGQSLTTVEVLAQLQKKDNVKQRKVHTSTKTTTESGIKRKRSVRSNIFCSYTLKLFVQQSIQCHSIIDYKI